MKALILAAGMGNRLGCLTQDLPKALVEVSGTRLIDHTLQFLDDPQITDIGVVGGYCHEQMSAYLKNRQVSLFFNPHYKEGNITTLGTALDFIDDDTLILNVDHIYPKKLLSHIINNVAGISAMCDFNRKLGADDMKVKLSSNGHLKKISKQLTDFDGGYIGMTFISKNMVTIYKKAVGETSEIYGRNSCVEFILGHLAANNVPINICDTSDFKWLEVDTPEDLAIAEKSLMHGI